MSAYSRMTPLRHAMIQEMSDRRLSPRTIEVYVHWVAALAKYHGVCPSRLTDEQINRYLLEELIRKKDAAWSSVNQALCAIRFLRGQVLRMDVSALRIPPRKREQRLPEVLTPDEVRRILAAHPKNNDPGRGRRRMTCQMAKETAGIHKHGGGAHPAALLRDPPPATGHRPGHPPAHARAQQPEEHHALPARGHRGRFRRTQSSRPRVRPCPRPTRPPWRRRSAATGRLFCEPTRSPRRCGASWRCCRTAALGGHLHRCDHCGHEEPRHNSCGNRHYPNCQALARETWLAKQEASLLEVPYFHMVFTLPSELQPLILQNKFFPHTLPAGFTRIRHYGYLGNATGKQSVARIRELIGQTVPPPETETATERIERVYGVNLRQCPHCKAGHMHVVENLSPCKGQSP